jgi:hypothetical protein
MESFTPKIASSQGYHSGEKSVATVAAWNPV